MVRPNYSMLINADKALSPQSKPVHFQEDGGNFIYLNHPGSSRPGVLWRAEHKAAFVPFKYKYTWVRNHGTALPRVLFQRIILTVQCEEKCTTWNQHEEIESFFVWNFFASCGHLMCSRNGMLEIHLLPKKGVGKEISALKVRFLQNSWLTTSCLLGRCSRG